MVLRSPPSGEKVSQELGAPHGTGHGRPQHGGEDLLSNRVWFHGAFTMHPCPREFRRRAREINHLACERCPVPFSRYLSPVRTHTPC